MARKDKERYEKEKADYKTNQQSRTSESGQSTPPSISQVDSKGLMLPSEIEVPLAPSTRYVPGWIPHAQFPPYGPHSPHLATNGSMASESLNGWGYMPPNMYGSSPHYNFMNHGSNMHPHPQPPIQFIQGYNSGMMNHSSSMYQMNPLSSPNQFYPAPSSHSSVGPEISASSIPKMEELKEPERNNIEANATFKEIDESTEKNTSSEPVVDSNGNEQIDDNSDLKDEE
jgi:hypothetical protein